jgi:hypothetical protein
MVRSSVKVNRPSSASNLLNFQNFKKVPLFGLDESDDDTETESDQKLQLYLKTPILTDVGLKSLVRMLWVCCQ